jgi:NADH-quinone oxidoreductase subunit M
MEAAMIGVFISLNTVLFYIFWEGMLVPMYLLIAVWGGPRRDYASVKFFLYTFAGSVFLLVALIVLYVAAGSFFMPELMEHRFARGIQYFVFACCTVAFAIKIPLYPLHTWLPAAHVEAPTAGSVILAGILLKMGAYGLLRFCLPLAPAATLQAAPVMLGLAAAAIIIGGYLALGQHDLKRLIAYSSVAHMGFVVLGIFLLSSRGIQGSVLQMINHGISTGALFICIGIIYERSHSRELADNTALGRLMPLYVTLLTIFSLSSFGFPGTNGFVGEFLIIIAAFSKYMLLGALAVPGVLLSAAYMLRMVQKIVWADSDGSPASEKNGRREMFRDIDLRECCVLLVLAIFVLLIGLQPAFLLDIMSASVRNLAEQTLSRAHGNP